MRAIKIILIILGGIFFTFSSLAAIINPESYRQDYYRMPVQNEIQEKAVLKFKLNLEIPRLTPEQPVIVIDEDGNKVVYFQGKVLFSLAKDGTITHFFNGIKIYSEKILDSGERYFFRSYKRHSHTLIEIQNEFGETLGWEILGLDDRVIERWDADKRPLFRLEYDGRYYWEHDLINNIWRRLECGIPKEERLGAKDGPLIAYWEKGSFFGKEGLWRIEKGWDGQNIVDMYYTLYSSSAREDYEKYHREGYLVERKDRSGGLRLYEVFGDGLDYIRYGDFGPIEEGDIYHEEHILRWTYEYEGSRLRRAKRFYQDMIFYDERIYDINENIDKVVRRHIETDEILCLLEDRVYFWEVEDMSIEELSDFFNISQQGAEELYEWIQGMKSKNKASASLFGIIEPVPNRMILYDEHNRPLCTIPFRFYY
jgi:hypothetical protein